MAVDLDGISADEIDTGEQPLPEEATVAAFGRVMEENVQVTQAPAIRDLRARKPLGMIDMAELLRPDLWLAARPPTVGGLRRPTSLPTTGRDPTSPATPIRETMATPALRALGAFSESITKELRLNASINELWPEAGGARFVAASDASAADPTARLSEEEWAAITETFYPDRPPTHAAPEAPTMTENRNLLKGSQTPPSVQLVWVLRNADGTATGKAWALAMYYRAKESTPTTPEPAGSHVMWCWVETEGRMGEYVTPDTFTEATLEAIIPSHLRDGSASPGSRTRSNGHLSLSTGPTPQSPGKPRAR